MGKTRLCEEVIARARTLGLGTAWVSCPETRSVPAYFSWQETIRQLTESSLPISRVHSGGDDPELARVALFEAAGAALRAATAKAPACVVIDDLHWADVASVRLLATLAPQLRATPLLVVATYRARSCSPGTPVGESLAELVRHGRWLQLSSLTVPEVDEVVTALTAVRPSPRLVEELHRQTGGNPLFVTEVVRLLAAEGDHALVAHAGHPETLPLPPSVTATLAAVIARTSTGCQRLFEVAAVIGVEFAVDTLESVLGVVRAEVIDRLSEAVAAGVVREVSPGLFGFAHPLARIGVYDGLRVAERVRLHERVGEALERRQARGLSVDATALAYHFAAAAVGGPAGKAVRYAVDAGHESMAQLAYEAAARLYGQALDVLDLAPDAADRVALSLWFGDALAAAGERRDARVSYLAAADLARRAGRAEDLAAAALGVAGGAGFEVGLFDDEQVALLEQARAALGGEPSALLAEVTARLSVALSQVGTLPHRQALSEKAVTVARVSRDNAALAHALAAHCDTIADPDHVEQRLSEASEIIEIGIALDHPQIELLGRRLRLVALLELGDMSAADAEIEAYAATAAPTRQPRYTWFVPLWRGMRALMEGRLVEQAAYADDAQATGTRGGSPNAAVLATVQRWTRLAESGESAALTEHFDTHMATAGVLPVFTVPVKAYSLAVTGQSGDAAALLTADAAALRAAPLDSEWLPMLAQLSDVISILGGHGLADWTYDSLLPYRHRWTVEGIGAACRGPVERHLGLLAAARGDAAAAQGHFAAAMTRARRAGATLLVARIEAEAARVLPTSHTAELPALLREGGIWTMAYGGRTVRVKDTKGMADLARLLAQPGQEIHALDLMGAAVVHGSAGEPIDATARRAYKHRVAELETDLADADASGDAGLSVRLAAERDALIGSLASAYGIGGRVRPTGAASERARSAVAGRIRDVLRRIDTLHPALGLHLRRSIHTGTYCAYRPETPTKWKIESSS